MTVTSLIYLGGYTVGVAGQTVNLLPSGSGGSTPSPPTLFGGLAQLGERLPCKQKVTGSSPVSSTLLGELKYAQFNKEEESSSTSQTLRNRRGAKEYK